MSVSAYSVRNYALELIHPRLFSIDKIRSRGMTVDNGLDDLSDFYLYGSLSIIQ
jgi:hypothetical protein